MADIQPDKANALPGTYTELSCGCEMWNEPDGEDGKLFVMRPCSPFCQHYGFALAESARQHVPPEFRRG